MALSRSERLGQVMDLLSTGAARRAEDMAAAFGVTMRTIYRDMDALRAAGVSIEGTRGRGYRASHALTLPPVSLSERELEALYLGLAAIEAGDDGELSAAAAALSERLDEALPDDRTRPANLVAGARLGAGPLQEMAVFRAALRAKQKVRADFEGGAHILRPLALRHWGRLWSFVAWSETYSRFVNGALTGLTAVTPLPELFVDEPGRRLEDFGPP